MRISRGTKTTAAVVGLVAAGTVARAASGSAVPAWQYGLLGVFAVALLGFVIDDQRHHTS